MTKAFTILHVEDDPNDVLLLQRALKKLNINADVRPVSDGDQAVAYLTEIANSSDGKAPPVPGLVLLDLKMPRKSGLEVLAWIRSQPRFKRLLVVVFTSSRHDDDLNKAYDLGANSYLVKPVEFESLRELMNSVIHYWSNLNQHPPL